MKEENNKIVVNTSWSATRKIKIGIVENVSTASREEIWKNGEKNGVGPVGSEHTFPLFQQKQ